MTKPNSNPPAFNVSLSVLILPCVIVAAGALGLVNPAAYENAVSVFGLNPILIRMGSGLGLFTYPFLHGSIISALFNAALLLAFGASVMRAMGQGGIGFLSFLAFFMICSVTAGLAFSMAHASTNVTVIGASAAISGIIGAAIRMPGMWGNTNPIAPLKSRQVIAFSLFWCAYHGVFALVYYLNPGEVSIDMAWESHLSGYFLGILLIEPWLHAFNPKYFVNFE